MTDEILILMQGTIVRAACERMGSAHLKALSDSVQQASCLPGRFAWDRKAAVHAEIFNLLGDATGDPVLARVAGLAVGWTHHLALTVGPVADSIILNSRRRLLHCLTAGDADGAAREMERHLSGLCFMGRLAQRCA
jgi:GntR family transcriptional regulator, transcriptional repressor for pyruvate dehydrogenase complex